MKGAISLCLKYLVLEKYGKEKWSEIYKELDYDFDPVYSLLTTNPDKFDYELIDCICKKFDISIDQLADDFGEYWMNNFAPKHYSSLLLKYNSARDLLLHLDDLHDLITKEIDNARPPRFKYEWMDNNTLVMTYISHRNLFVLLKGLVKGVAKYFNEQISIKDLGDNKLEIVFS